MEPHPQTTGVSPVWRAFTVLACLGMIAFYNSLSAGFIFDDWYFVRAEQLRNPFSSELMGNRPVIAVSLSMNYYLDGLNPRGYHFLNLLSHIVAATVLFDLVRRILLLPNWAIRFEGRSEKLALIVAALWLVHPLQTQSVTYMIQRCESMMGLFYLLSLWGLLRFIESHGAKKWALLAYVASALSCGCKEVAVSIPLVALLLERAFVTESWREIFRQRWGFYLGYFVVTFCCIYLTVVARGAVFTGQGAAGFGVGLYTPTTYALTQTHVILYYFKLSFWPSPLCLDYIDWPIAKSFADAWKTAIPLGLIVLATFMTTLLRPSWGTLLAIFFVILGPTSTFVPIQDAIFEHRMYLSLGALIASVVFLVDFALRKLGEQNAEASLALTRLSLLLLVVVLGIFTLRCAVRNGDYSGMLKMYSDVVQKRPNNFRARSNLSLALLQTGRYQEAKKHAEVALSFQPGNPNYLNGMAATLFDSGEPEAAWATLQRVKNIAESSAITWELPLTAAKTLLVLNRPEEALTFIQMARQTLPNDPRNDQFAGMAYLMLKRNAEATIAFNSLQKRAPSQMRDLNNLARYTAFLPSPNRSQLRMARLSAESACHMSENSKPEFLDTLAIVIATEAALAQAKPLQQSSLTGAVTYRPSEEAINLFGLAAQKAAEAARLAESKGNSYLAERIRERQKLFLAQKRYLGS
jgi:protein O-mannosyl-transferase